MFVGGRRNKDILAKIVASHMKDVKTERKDLVIARIAGSVYGYCQEGQYRDSSLTFGQRVKMTLRVWGLKFV